MSRDIVVQDREELIFLLCEAAEFEHTVMCTYLYAMWSLKREPDSACSEADLEAVERWRTALRKVALEEMLHLTLVNNLLASLGAAAHLSRPDFPIPPGRFPADVVFSLRPFDAETIAHFAFIERPEGIELQDGAGFSHPAHYARVGRPELLTPTPQDYTSQGHLYHGIARGLHDLVERFGENEVFVGHGDAQLAGAEFRLPGLFKITDLASALRAVEEIVVQGEGAPTHSEESHYAVFLGVQKELVAMQAARPGFQPAFVAVSDPILVQDIGEDSDRLVKADDARRAVDIGDAVYGLMMRTFVQVTSPSPLPKPLRQGLASVATELMYALSTVGERVMRLPAGITDGPHAGKSAGLTLQLSGSVGQLVQSSAAQILGERAAEIGAAARALDSEVPLADVAARLEALAGRLVQLHEQFEAHITVSVDALAAGVIQTDDGAADTGATQDAIEDAENPNAASTSDITLRFDTARCIHSRWCVMSAPTVFLANVKGAWLHPETTSLEKIVEVAHTCPSGAVSYERLDGGPAERAPAVNAIRIRENGPYGVRADVDLIGHERLLRATLCRCGKSRNKPFCDNSHKAAAFAATGEPTTIESEPLEDRGGLLAVEPLTNGPLQVTGSVEICSGTGRTVSRTESCRLCRCGGSKTKPFCDNTHARIGFRSDR